MPPRAYELTRRDILAIRDNWCPMLVFSISRRSWISRLILWRTRGQESGSHVMTLLEPGILASQDWVFRRRPIADFLRGKHRLVFLWRSDLYHRPLARARWRASIRAALIAPLWQRLYDWPGVVGQAAGMTWINLPWRDYCSERVAENIRESGVEPRLRLKHPSPAALYRELRRLGWEVWGRYEAEETGAVMAP